MASYYHIDTFEMLIIHGWNRRNIYWKQFYNEMILDRRVYLMTISNMIKWARITVSFGNQFRLNQIFLYDPFASKWKSIVSRLNFTFIIRSLKYKPKQQQKKNDFNNGNFFAWLQNPVKKIKTHLSFSPWIL